MSLKAKLISTVVSICLVIAMVTFGVIAAQSVSYSLNGVVFLADGVAATIYDGTVENGEFVESVDPSLKMKDIEITLTTDEEDLTELKESWQGLDLMFNEQGEPTVISFYIRNDNKGSELRVQSEVTALEGTNPNATIKVNNSDKILAVGESFKFEIKFEISNSDRNVNIENFQVSFTLSLVE